MLFITNYPFKKKTDEWKYLQFMYPTHRYVWRKELQTILKENDLNKNRKNNFHMHLTKEKFQMIKKFMQKYWTQNNQGNEYEIQVPIPQTG